MSTPRALEPGTALAGVCRGTQQLQDLDPEQMGLEFPSSLGLVGFCHTGFAPLLSQRGTEKLGWQLQSPGAPRPHHQASRNGTPSPKTGAGSSGPGQVPQRASGDLTSQIPGGAELRLPGKLHL